ncbi:hypothetical protein BGW36DRAFT_370334 [Talaromyces proteolyticus]|uniref:Invertebrate defensins family profile domain-containing protein n=1 Tax=Talaromyces proteolyticus TaxID=1131652 RepID=A0AAD4Q5A8_9EURO|nr:uncharacterized protein BGW36DRAFT_370334 [Talaromyces proteolyticus]KAH8703984.1 hypothetical protein BGW36DRAFT_370334 [Talaromyces proteolyticus]
MISKIHHSFLFLALAICQVVLSFPDSSNIVSEGVADAESQQYILNKLQCWECPEPCSLMTCCNDGHPFCTEDKGLCYCSS